MSAAAETYAQRVTHPRVKGGTRALLLAIATHVPEGQTTTPPMTLDDLALTAQHTARTARTCRNLLEAIGLIQVHDGGRGNKARYELVHLAEGARPIIPAPLPLLGPAKPRQAKEQRSTSDLFADVTDPIREEKTNNVGSFFLRFATVLQNVGNFFLRWRDLAIRQRRPADPRGSGSAGASLDRARDVPPPLHERTTTAAAPPPEPRRPRPAKPPPCPSFGRAHGWCDGRMHVPLNLHREERRKLARSPGETDADLDARLFARYAAILAAVPETEPIVDRNEFEFWKRRLRTAPAPRPRPEPTIQRVPGDDVWADVLRVIETAGAVNRHTFVTWFLPTQLVEDRDTVIVVAGPRAHDDLFVDYVEKHYGDVVRQAIATVRPGARIEFVRQHRRSG